MAGTAKPNIEQLLNEVTDYTINDSNVTGSANGLFNEVIANEWDSQNVCYWRADNYVDITIGKACNIYRSGTDDWPGSCSKLQIYSYNDSNDEWIDVTELHSLDTTQLKCNEWEMFVVNLPAGRYKFVGTTYRIDSEWYLESIPEAKCIIKSRDKYYSFSSSNYNTESKMYNEIFSFPEEVWQSYTDLFAEVTIGSETFRPIKKFENCQLVFANKIDNFSIDCLKSKEELIVANGDIDLSVASKISSLKILYNKDEYSSLKIALSLDSGTTWNTVKDSILSPLDIVIPQVDYDLLSDNELVMWNQANDEILANGISCETFNTLDWNTILRNQGELYEKVRFAYVINISNKDSICENKNISWIFDAIGHFSLMSPVSEYNVELYKNSVCVTSQITNSIIKVMLIM